MSMRNADGSNKDKDKDKKNTIRTPSITKNLPEGFAEDKEFKSDNQVRYVKKEKDETVAEIYLDKPKTVTESE